MVVHGKPRRATTKDVAQRAGVAQGTVSNFLNHPEMLSPPKREAVERAIAELGYVRHEAARHLRTGYSQTIGMLLLDTDNPGFIHIARGVEDYAIARGWNVLIANSARDLERERAYLRAYAEARVAGLIVVPHDEFDEGAHDIRAGGMPAVVIDRLETGHGNVSVGVDDVAGGRLAGQHLVELGHRHVVFVGDHSTATPVHDRMVGLRAAMTAAGGSLDLLPSELSVDGGRVVGIQLANQSAAERPTAVVAAIDLIAFGVLQALLQYGVRVPDDISLVGYDDVPFAKQLSVPLTSVRRPHYEMGAKAAELLLAELSGDPVRRRHVVFDPALIVRSSTATPPSHPAGR
ncbi:MAG: Transcriptional regulator, LacI family [Mycobacterium sp.]|nr:Transcriptional regulator, LacI family [Mycobacterium sp.]MDT5177066.1 LacI family transcriptional regulator [Mycobacterium sp.]